MTAGGADAQGLARNDTEWGVETYFSCAILRIGDYSA
jgi:hypothetical protein